MFIQFQPSLRLSAMPLTLIASCSGPRAALKGAGASLFSMLTLSAAAAKADGKPCRGVLRSNNGMSFHTHGSAQCTDVSG